MKPVILTLAALSLIAFRAPLSGAGQDTDPKTRPWQSEFPVGPGELGPTGRTPFFVLEPGRASTLEDGSVRLVVTVLDQITLVAGVQTRVVEERETKGGKPVEVSRNYFAISRRTNAVYYFGEDVDMYDRSGRVTSHEGSWRAGASGAKFGLMMPGEIVLHARFYQELAPKIALDRAEIVSTTAVVKTPAGEFKDCVKTEETTPLEPGVKEYKYYAKGIGLVQDGSLKLVKFITR